jgi:acyl-lipid (8-3)-desaturase
MAAVFTAEEVAKHCRVGDCWVILFDEVFDVTDFMKNDHTGGYFPLSAAGKDCTALFVSIHPTTAMRHLRSPAFRAKCLKGRVQPASRTWNFDEPFYLDTKLAVERYLAGASVGSGDHPVLYVRAVAIFAAFVAAWYVSFYRGNAMLVPVFGAVALVMGFEVVHAVNHGSLSRRGWCHAACQFMANLTMNSSPMWREQHSVGHHIATNHADDIDVQNAPFLRHNPRDEYKWYYRYQHLYMYPMYATTYVPWVIGHFARTHARANYLPSEKVNYYAAMAIVVYAMLYLPARKHGLAMTALMVATYFVVISVGISSVFTVSHMNERAELDATRNWAENQVRSTVNWGTGNEVANFLTGGLNHQIEHHLFPSVHPVHYPAISRIVRAKCRKHGIPYRSNDKGFLAGFWTSLRQHREFTRNMGQCDRGRK